MVNVALADHPASERLLFMRGLIHATAGDLEAAEQDFQRSENGLSAKDLGAIGLGASYLQSGRYDEAVSIIKAKLRDKPDDAALLYLLAEALIRSGATPHTPAYTIAQDALERSTKIDPSLCLPHIELGKLYLSEKRTNESIEQFERAKAIDPTERAAYSHLAVAYRRLGETEKANEALIALKAMSNQDRIAETKRMKSVIRELPAGVNPP